MSNVASLEHCKELYELSGWNPHDLPDHPGSNGKLPYVPAYDLGYLLRKLPRTAITRIDQNDFKNAEWVADSFLLRDRKRKPVQFRADTPEDAAANLAIELFKQGVLKNV